MEDLYRHFISLFETNVRDILRGLGLDHFGKSAVADRFLNKGGGRDKGVSCALRERMRLCVLAPGLGIINS